jgi:hypothetical protein
MRIIRKLIVPALFGALPLNVVAQPPGDSTDPNATRPPTEAPLPAEVREIRLSQLNDFHFATWTLIESDSINKVDHWAEERVADPAVKQFARDSIAAHERLLRQLQGPLVEAFQQEGAPANEKFDFGAMLQEVGKRLNEMDTAPATPAVRVEATPRQDATSDSNPPQTEPATPRARERRIGRRPSDATREESIRRRREAMDTLRANLPGLLDELGESVEAADRDTENVGLAFIELKRQLGEQYATSMIEELDRGPQADITPGYLGIQLVSNLQLINTMSVAKNHASPELQATLQQGIDEARIRVEQARQLMSRAAGDRASSPPRP